ncbi:hypothetical protein [Terrihabitans sp. B22-R8]|uniref:hypothetical protein n=1 Tax=Terrihabitans sp. B22-R8 TaxID=3425128 RepID=UPI00403C7AB9
MNDTTKNQLTALQDRLMDAQRSLLLQAAEADMLPSDNALRKIADLELAIGAIEALVEEE